MTKKQLEEKVTQQEKQICDMWRTIRALQEALERERIYGKPSNQPNVLPMAPSTPFTPPWSTPTAPIPNKPWWQQVYCGTSMN